MSATDHAIDLAAWLGRTETRTDAVTAAPVAALAATLDRDDPAPGPAAPLPPLWHWLYFLPMAAPERDRPRRPSAARRLPAAGAAAAPHVGRRPAGVRSGRCASATRRRARSRIADVARKSGRTGPLVFVTVRHEISTQRRRASLSEEHDIVYRDLPAPGERRAAGAGRAARRSLVARDRRPTRCCCSATRR